jgi:hypothetical protein
MVRPSSESSYGISTRTARSSTEAREQTLKFDGVTQAYEALTGEELPYLDGE